MVYKTHINEDPKYRITQ